MKPEEEMEALKGEQGQPTTGPVSIPQIPKRFSSLRCPKCDSSRIRKRSTPFLINIGVFIMLWFVVTLCLRWFAVSLFLIGLRSVLFVVGIISFFALFVTASLALVGRHRCRSCGHRFRSMYETEQSKAGVRFPIRFCVLGAVILFLTIVIGRPLIMIVSDAEYWEVVLLGVLTSVVAWPTVVGVLLIYQAVVYRFLKTRIRRGSTWATLFILPAIAISVFTFYDSLQARRAFLQDSQPTVKAQRILSYGRLAPLPESASDIKVYSWSSPFSGEWFLRFSAIPEDIEEFLNTSPSIKGAECVMYSREKMKLPYPEDYWQNTKYFHDGHEYFDYHSTGPEWYKPEIRGRGRYYRIRPKVGFKRAEVIVDDEEHLIFVKLVWS